jgi:hypothetical protein
VPVLTNISACGAGNVATKVANIRRPISNLANEAKCGLIDWSSAKPGSAGMGGVPVRYSGISYGPTVLAECSSTYRDDDEGEAVGGDAEMQARPQSMKADSVQSGITPIVLVSGFV